MKPKFKVLIAGVVTAAAAAFSTGASAQSIFELHEQHRAQVLSLLFGNRDVQAAISVGPAYAPAPVYQAPPPVRVSPYGVPYGHGPRWDDHRHHRDYDRHDDRGYRR